MTSESARDPDADAAPSATAVQAEETVTAAPEVHPEGSDQVEMPFRYDHGRMPFFMKLIWIGFLAFATWYLATYMLDAINADLGN